MGGSLSSKPKANNLACTSDNECEGGYICKGGSCVLQSSQCSSDSDCDYGYKCQAGSCILKPQCSYDFDCSLGYSCQNGNCVKQNSILNNSNGLGSNLCQNGAIRSCGSDIGECVKGNQTCSNGVWGNCTNSVNAVNETCDGKDNNCNDQIDEGGICQGINSTCSDSDGNNLTLLGTTSGNANGTNFSVNDACVDSYNVREYTCSNATLVNAVYDCRNYGKNACSNGACVTQTQNCGDGVCSGAETSSSCPQDCPINLCGNGICDSGETYSSCPADCTQPQSQNLLAYYNFDEASGSKVYDANGVYNGTLITPYTRISGKLNGAYNFSGSGHAHVDPAPRITTGQFTFEAWVKPSVLDWTQTLFYTPRVKICPNPNSCYWSGDSFIVRFHGYTDDCLHAILFKGNGDGTPYEAKSTSCGNYWLDGNWHRVDVTYGNTILRLYVDGIQESNLSLPGVIFPTDAAFDIGTQIFGSTGSISYSLKGSIDEIKYWDYAKTSFEA